MASKDHVELAFSLGEREPPLTIPGVIVRIRFLHRHAQLGIRFDEHAFDRNQTVERKLTDYVMRRQREMLPTRYGMYL